FFVGFVPERQAVARRSQVIRLPQGIVECSMTLQTPGLKAALKRGALVAAANWPLVIVQFVAESSLKLMLAVPIVGGAFLVALVLDTSLTDLLSGDVRDIVTAIISALVTNPAALIAFVTATL